MKLLVCFVLLFVATNAFAHSGGTDADGGHMDHSNNTYHYHHGMGPHEHENGECPYQFESRSNGSHKSYNETTKVPIKLMLIVSGILLLAVLLLTTGA